MKKYNIMVVMLTGMYLILAAGMYFFIRNVQNEAGNEYRVEISRISKEFQEDGMLDKVQQDVEEYYELNKERYRNVSCIHHVVYMKADIEDAAVITKFYEPENEYGMEIVPVVQNHCVTGYLRFDYKKDLDIGKYLMTSQIFLFIIYFIAASVLVYTKHKIIKPFHQFCDMPYELARGNLHDGIFESKNRYFGRFLWGIEMLKDSLESHKRKELKLAKDKKMILLSLSHDIKTPLNAIYLYAKALEQDIYETEKEKKEAALRIQEKTAQIDDFVKEIMKSSTEDIVTIEVRNSEYYLADLIEKIDVGFSNRCFLNKMKFTMEVFDNRLLKGDIDRMYEVVGNLIDNAFKYGDGKYLSISFTEEDYCLLIHVYNTGTLVNDNEMPHLFDSFYRGSNTEGKAGNGLGLYICSKIMKKMNGDIFAKQAEAGMEFVVVCPMS